MNNPYDPPTLDNCHNTLKQAYEEGRTAGYKEWVDSIEKSGLLHLYHSEVKEKWKALKESKGIKEINK